VPRSFTNVALILAALIAAAIPVVAMRFAVHHHAVALAQAVMTQQSERMLEHAEGLVAEAADALAAVAPRAGVECSAETRAILSGAVAEATQLRHLLVRDSEGRVACASSELPEERETILHVRPTRVGDVSIALARHRAEGRHALHVIRNLGDSTLVAILAPNAHRLDVVPADWRASAVATLTFDDGAPIATLPPGAGEVAPAVGAARAVLVVDRVSDALPLRAGMIVPEELALAPYRPLGLFVDVGGLIVGVVFVVLAWNLARRQRTLEDAIARGMRLDEFVPYYQPVFDLRTGALVGCEALIRWQKRDGTIVPPGMFIQQAEESGLAVAMTRRLMEKCRDELGRCYATRPRLKVAINLFADHFEDMSTVEDVRRIFATGGVSFGQVVLEVTERYPLSNLTRAKVAISALQELGCRVALDDAGTGHGGLAYLQKLGLDQIKIDKVFIDTITSTTASSPIVDSLTDLARSMRMEVVAEGVETIQQVEYLRRRGVDQAQGYLFAKPLPGPLYLDLIEAMDSVGVPDASAPVDEPAGLRDAA
jgi:sensor c-di-GMP phosphodiesterase-like protein